MKFLECPRETDVLDAIESGEWSAELTQHAELCPLCQDLRVVAAAFSHDYDQVLAEVRVPPAALVWWRAELAARQEATRKANRPITLIHALAVACGLGVGVGVGRNLIAPVPDPVARWLGVLWDTLSTDPAAALSEGLPPVSSPIVLALLAAAGFCLLVAPIAGYFLFSDD